MTAPSPLKLSLVFCAVAVFAVPALAESQARIVRLSDVQGSVQIDKNTGLGFENAFVNLPITQGVHLKTGATGRAEVEFEDGSSMRLTPNTTVEFSKLNLTDAGQRVSEVNLVDGMAYVNWLGKDDFALNFSREKVSLDRAAHFRVDTSTEMANLAVFKGDVDVQGPNGNLAVAKKKTATFDAANDDKSKIENKIAEAPLDSWDKEAVSYHDEYAKNNASSPYGYGLSDLNYYGAYQNVPGYGMMWQPYFAGVGWDPFMNGAWGWYPGFGYMYASAYPWGWLPYRYGAWSFVPGFGWMWQPGGWGGWVSTPVQRPTTLVHVTPLVAPTAGNKTVLVGRASTTAPMMTSRYTVNAGSAGMGIPRGSLGNLNHLNHQVAKTGFAQVQPAPQFSVSSPHGNSRPSYGQGGGGRSSGEMGVGRSSTASPSMGRGSAPPATHSSPGGAPHR
ncbi:MAG TPA: FecR family protein [Candidatus Sulfotelmatobacter sp.]|nr:FecR family protein [Candidatus Sulfotelmatobacter sp.]